jgi:Tol biopolymer transport system component
MRRINELELRPIPGTERGQQPHFSPDGQYLAFTQSDLGSSAAQPSFRKVSVTGGPSMLIMDSARDGSWGKDGSMVAAREDGLYLIEPDRDPRRVVEGSTDMAPRRPHMLPDGSGILFDTGGGLRGRRVMLWDRGSDELRLIAAEGSNPRYLPTGHVVYLTLDNSMLAVPFDLDRNEVSGTPVPLLEDVWAPLNGYAAFAVSDGGTMLYATALSTGENERLAWMGMNGEAVDLPVRVDDFEDPRVSPDGRFVAYDDFVKKVVGVYDLLTGSNITLPVYGFFAWAHDSRSLFVGDASHGLVRVPANGVGPIDTLSRLGLQPYSASPDGAWLVAGTDELGTNSYDLVRISLTGADQEPIPYLRADWDEYQGDISPDGRWLAYISQETGESEVFIRSFPEPGLPIQASVGGGVGPVWAPNGSAVYFVSGGALVRGDFRAGANPGVTNRTEVFRVDGYEVSAGAFMEGNHARRRYDIHPDGKRFLMTQSHEELFAIRQPVIVVTNWFEELREKMGE